ncbi:MAG: M15 family metallopeptidase [Clostridia bacterium]|nr:M15 family metallopeptidase [Clostridia bacterium]
MLIGTAIDINPLYNPYITKNSISPTSGIAYVDRDLDCQYQIKKNDILYKIFKKHGWSWGGDWTRNKDYQHFEKREF